MKHTEGPWESVEGFVGENGIYYIQQKNKKKDIGEAYGKANAHLIASAPELLSACREAIKALYEACPSVKVDSLQYKTLNVLKDAVAKAEGRA